MGGNCRTQRRIAGLAPVPALEVRGISNPGFIDSIYFRDPNASVIELTAKKAGHDEAMNAERQAHEILESWQASKRQPATAAS